MANGFGLEEKNEKYIGYIGRWVIISPYNSHDRHGGKLVGFKENDAVLNPYYGPFEVDSEKGIVFGTVEDDNGHRVSIDVPLSIRDKRS